MPGDLTDDNVFSLKMQAAEDLGDNTELLEKRRTKLEKEGGYRIYEPKGKLKGLRRRIDTHTWSREVHEVKDFPAPGIVEDTEGTRTLTKFAKPVPWDSSRIVEKQAAPAPTNLEPFAKMLGGTLPGQGQSFSQAAKELKAQAGFSDARKMAKLTFKEFVTKFPQYLRVHDGRIYSVAPKAAAAAKPAAKAAPAAPAAPAPPGEDAAERKRLVKNEHSRAYHKAVRAALDRGESPAEAKTKGRLAGQAVLARHSG